MSRVFWSFSNFFSNFFADYSTRGFGTRVNKPYGESQNHISYYLQRTYANVQYMGIRGLVLSCIFVCLNQIPRNFKIGENFFRQFIVSIIICRCQKRAPPERDFAGKGPAG